MQQRGKLIFMVRNNHLVHRVYANTGLHTHAHTHTQNKNVNVFSAEVRFQALGILALLSSILHSANRRHRETRGKNSNAAGLTYSPDRVFL